MPTAHDHYRLALECLDVAEVSDLGSPTERYNLTRAQVHATLALAAAHGADRPPLDTINVRTVSDPPEQGQQITDQMGDVVIRPSMNTFPPAPGEMRPDGQVEPVEAVIYCGGQTIREDGDYDCMLPDGHDGAHVDAEGREFR